MGFRSGEWGGRYRSFAPTASIASHSGNFVAGKVVDDYCVAGRERRDEHLLDIDEESVAGHGTFQYPGRDQTVVAQAAGEGCGFPMTPRG